MGMNKICSQSSSFKGMELEALNVLLMAKSFQILCCQTLKTISLIDLEGGEIACVAYSK